MRIFEAICEDGSTIHTICRNYRSGVDVVMREFEDCYLSNNVASDFDAVANAVHALRGGKRVVMLLPLGSDEPRGDE